MRVLTYAMAAGVITSLAMGQSQPTSAPAEASQRFKAPTRPARDVKQILNGRVPEVNFEEAPLEEVMEWVEKYTGAMVYVRWPVLEEVGIECDTPITVKARNRKLSLILWVILNEAKGTSGVTLAYEASAELFLFSTHEDLSGEMMVRIYDVRDITVDVPEFVGPPAPSAQPVPRGSVRRRVPAHAFIAPPPRPGELPRVKSLPANQPHA